MGKIDAAISALKSQGHIVEGQFVDGKTWYQIDRRMRATPEEMQNLADGIYSLSELEELYIQRRVETVDPDELAESVITEWARYAEVGHAKDLTTDFKEVAEKAFDL